MKLYNFDRLVQKYSVHFHFLVQTDGHYESGKWVKGEQIVQDGEGAIIPMSNERIKQSGGVYTTKERQLYMLQPIPEALKGAKVCYENCIYSVEADTDYSDYCDVYVYTLKWVSLFDEEARGNYA